MGRGATDGITADAFEQINFSAPYFDPEGVTIACEGDEIRGFVHAGFAPNPEETALATETGVICAVVVHPQYRRGGIGTELVRRAETYLKNAGAQTILAGPAPPQNPFFVGLYGGAQPAGFLDSDPPAVPFFTALGYEIAERYSSFERNIADGSDPVNMQLITIRRKTQLAIVDEQTPQTWWWQARFGQLDTVRFALVSKTGDTLFGAVTIVGLDFFLPKWRQRAVGLIDLHVPPEHRREGYGQALLVELCRRLRQEMISLLQAPLPDDDQHTQAMFQAAGFQPADAGTVFKKTE